MLIDNKTLTLHRNMISRGCINKFIGSIKLTISSNKPWQQSQFSLTQVRLTVSIYKRLAKKSNRSHSSDTSTNHGCRKSWHWLWFVDQKLVVGMMLRIAKANSRIVCVINRWCPPIKIVVHTITSLSFWCVFDKCKLLSRNIIAYIDCVTDK